MESAARSAPTPSNWNGVKVGLDKAMHLFGIGEYESAQLTLHEVLEFAPFEARAWHLLGRVLQAAGAHADALGCFSKAASLYGDNKDEFNMAMATVPLAELLWRQGDREAARAMLGLLILRKGDDPEILALSEAWKRQEA
jgi:Flp pilus assembly protein TadD